MAYGKELIIDLHNCNTDLFTRRMLKKYVVGLCEILNMERAKLTWWDYRYAPLAKLNAPPHLKGISVAARIMVQFITTSTVIIHTLEDKGAAYINVFSCKDFDLDTVKNFTADYFDGVIANSTVVVRL